MLRCLPCVTKTIILAVVLLILSGEMPTTKSEPSLLTLYKDGTSAQWYDNMLLPTASLSLLAILVTVIQFRMPDELNSEHCSGAGAKATCGLNRDVEQAGTDKKVG